MKVLVALQHSRPGFASSKSLSLMLQTVLAKDIQYVVPVKATAEELVELASDVDVIVCDFISKEAVEAAKNLKLVQRVGVGVDGIPFEVLKKDVIVTNLSGANPVPLAEGTVALVLALAKQIVRRHNLFPREDNTTGVELREKTAGIIGLGHIGAEVARLLKAFEMKIIAIKRHPQNDALKTQLNLDFLGGLNDLDYVLQGSDFVIVTVPLTKESRGMIGERELHFMKPTAYLVNTARADVIQEEPLYRALQEGWIAGAALDVWWSDHWWDPAWNPSGKTPLYPFWKLPNVIATPHNIGKTDSLSNAELQVIAENICCIAEGKPLKNQVDKELQY